MPRTSRPSGCLLSLLAAAGFGVVAYNVMDADPEGDGGGTRFAFLIVFGLLIVGGFRFAGWVRQLVGRGRDHERRGFPIEVQRTASPPTPPPTPTPPD